MSRSISLVRAVACVAAVTALMMVCAFSPPLEGGQASGTVMQLPVFVKDWFSLPIPPSEQEKTLLPADTEFINRTYYRPSDPKGVVMDFGIVLEGKDSRSIHKPEVCLDGQGWEIVKREERSIPIPDREALSVTDLSMTRAVPVDGDKVVEVRAHYVYWFIGRDKTTPSNLRRQFISMKDSLISSKTHRWAYAHLLAMENGKPGAVVSKDIDLMIETIAPYIMRSLGAAPNMIGARAAEGEGDLP